MVYQFVVTLRNTRARHIDRLSLLLLFISVLAFLLQTALPDAQYRYLFIFCAVLIVVVAGINLLGQQRHRPENPASSYSQPRTVYYRPALYLAAIGWGLMPEFKWLCIPFVILALIEHTAKKPLEIGFSDETVVMNTLFRRTWRWTDFNNVILKDDLLTLDFKNNRLFQRETIDEEGDAEEDEFNIYCRERLTKAHQRIVA
ncbi:MAG: hypothetical protein JST39_02720 [Bacteroidetes bacterium]|nr:hypothetical protein [Bacteroidota bacterium]